MASCPMMSDDENEDWVLVDGSKKNETGIPGSVNVNNSTVNSPALHGSKPNLDAVSAPSSTREPPDCLLSNCETFSTMGKWEKILKANVEATLLDHISPNNKPGCLCHFWFGGNFDGVEHTRIRYYVDGEATPSIDMELYLGHGMGFGDDHPHSIPSPWSNKYMGKIGARKNGIHNNYRIPFQKSIKVTAERIVQPGDNSSKHDDDDDDTPSSWWIIRGITGGRVTLGDVMLPPSARLYLHKVEQYTAQPLEEVNLCDIAGSSKSSSSSSDPSSIGAVFQVMIAAECPSHSITYLEGCMRAYYNNTDKKNPDCIMLSSGLEDYFLGTYYFDSGFYHTDTAGLTHFDKSQGRVSAYRFHDQDPLLISSTGGLRLTCRCGETGHGSQEGKPVLHPQPTIYTTYVWYYLWG